MPSHNGQQYRTHGQAARAAKEQPSQDKTDNSAGGDAVNDKQSPKGNVMMIKHGGTPEAPAPPFHVKHADGSKHGPMDSKEELMAHMHEHMGGEDQGMDDSQMDSDYGSEGSQEAIKTLLG